MPEVNPEMLKWARETAGFPLDLAAERLKIGSARDIQPPDRLAAYESGEKNPSRSLLRKMAKRYRRPLITFYLDHAPAAADSGQDFRRLPEGERGEADLLLQPLLRDIKARQGLMSSALRESEDRETIKFLGTLNRRAGVADASEAMLELLGLNRDEFSRFRNAEEAFKRLRARVEKLGVFVLLVGDLGSWHTQIEVKTFRGIALVDDWAPFIIINANDARPAWSFTLLHELAHLMVGESGVSGLVDSESVIEKFCNDVAAEVLLPTDQVAQIDLPEEFDLEAAAEVVSAQAAHRNVSRPMVAYRLYRSGRINRQQWMVLRDEFARRWVAERQNQRARDREKEGGPNGNTVRRFRLGDTLVAATREMLSDGQLSTGKAAKVLGVHSRRLGPFLKSIATD